MRSLHLFSACVLLLLVALPGGVRAQADTALRILSVDDSAFPRVSAVVEVEERDVPIADVALRDLTVTEMGAPALPIEVRRAVDSHLPLAVVIAIDVSGSMEEGGTLAKTQAAATTLINNLRPIDRVAVVSFHDVVAVVHPLSTDRAAAARAIESLRIQGATALYDAVVESARIAAGSGVDRRAIVLLSDGEESGEPHQFGREESLASAASGGSPFYVVGVGTSVDQAYLRELASRTGGRYFPAVGTADLPDVYATLESVLRSQTVVVVQSGAPREPRERSLTISFSRGSASASAQVDYLSRRSSAPAAGASASGPPVVLLGGLVLVALVAGFVVYRRQRARPRPAGGLVAETEAVLPAGEEMKPGEVEAHLRLVRVENGLANGAVGVGQVFAVRRAPASIGSAESCAIRVPSAPGVAPEHARVWLRDGRVMIHHLAPGHMTEIDGQAVQWASLDPGDEVRIGPYAFQNLGTAGM